MGTSHWPLTDCNAELSLQEQLAAQFRRAIHQKQLVPGDLVPASRPLAQQLGVSRGTVVSVMEQLAGEGYLVAHPGKGHFVAALDHLGQSKNEKESHTSPAVLAAPEHPRPVLDLRPGYPWTQGLGQDPLWKSAWRKATADLPDAALHEEEASGSLRLRAAVAEHLRRARGIITHPGNIHITSGTAEALVLITLTLNRIYSTAQIAVEDPGYPAARQALETAGARVHTVPTSADTGIAVEKIPASAHAVVTTPSHQYPLGGLMSINDRLALLRWADRHEAVVVEDDYDSEFRYGRPPLPALSTLSQGEQVMTIGSFSKILTPALRAGYIYADGALGRELIRTRAGIGASVSYLQQVALADYLESGGLARHIARMRREYRHRRDLLIRRLSGLAGVQTSATSGGLHAVLHTPVQASQLAAQLRARGTQVALLSSYYAEGLPQEEDGLVIGYGQTSSAHLSQALRQIQEILATKR
ncbi:MocR-like pyridoxine biosynthesis transcription factor PdxR [Nesterenkonia alkaliphila]|uniref:Aminotransferase class I/II-fold pyridoxal phosphate-dependent enzyme n=1 Tax=Nesterenkonia alkaliphila TaxID=1463631 RepID=A0A7K1UFT2_9MICC|nr:PLP-dependent aminotransferase family protein [Nesterenkonia alkaliphila]MVT25236.1 aminotransferase class I/II-fold pyridoxal phosphate-dependent enzyme [Nesterenkonia alkaliphila]